MQKLLKALIINCADKQQLPVTIVNLSESYVDNCKELQLPKHLKRFNVRHAQGKVYLTQQGEDIKELIAAIYYTCTALNNIECSHLYIRSRAINSYGKADGSLNLLRFIMAVNMSKSIWVGSLEATPDVLREELTKMQTKEKRMKKPEAVTFNVDTMEKTYQTLKNLIAETDSVSIRRRSLTRDNLDYKELYIRDNCIYANTGVHAGEEEQALALFIVLIRAMTQIKFINKVEGFNINMIAVHSQIVEIMLANDEAALLNELVDEVYAYVVKESLLIPPATEPSPEVDGVFEQMQSLVDTLPRCDYDIVKLMEEYLELTYLDKAVEIEYHDSVLAIPVSALPIKDRTSLAVVKDPLIYMALLQLFETSVVNECFNSSVNLQKITFTKDAIQETALAVTLFKTVFIMVQLLKNQTN